MKFVAVFSLVVMLVSAQGDQTPIGQTSNKGIYQPGTDAIGAGLSDEFEKALYNQGEICSRYR
jgi:hypothetical protein